MKAFFPVNYPHLWEENALSYQLSHSLFTGQQTGQRGKYVFYAIHSTGNIPLHPAHQTSARQAWIAA